MQVAGPGHARPCKRGVWACSPRCRLHRGKRANSQCLVVGKANAEIKLGKQCRKVIASDAYTWAVQYRHMNGHKHTLLPSVACQKQRHTGRLVSIRRLPHPDRFLFLSGATLCPLRCRSIVRQETSYYHRRGYGDVQAVQQPRPRWFASQADEMIHFRKNRWRYALGLGPVDQDSWLRAEPVVQ